MSAIKITNLYKKFGENVLAVDNSSFEIKDKEFVFLLGPSGCGKTTTLRMIAGLEQPTSGKIEIDGRNVTYLEPRDRNVGMVFEKHALYPHLSVFENLAYPLRVRKTPKSEMDSTIKRVTTLLKISELVDRMPSQLSGGQLQRVAIGRMLVRNATVFLMDEPISHLDTKLRAHMRVELKYLQKTLNYTTLYVSHDQLEAMSMADRIVVMQEGAIQQFDTPQRCFDLPVNEFVATFVGEPSMNILSCQIKTEGEDCFLVGDGFKFGVHRDWLTSQKAWEMKDKKLNLGFRPDYVYLPKEDEREGKDIIKGSIYTVEPMGTEKVYDVDISGVIVRVKALTKKTRFVDNTLGAPAHIEIDKRRVYLFDQKTGETVAQAQFALELQAIGKL